MPDVHSGTIHPFNISPEEAQRMFDAPPPSELIVPVVKLCTKGRASTHSAGHIPRRRVPGIHRSARLQQQGSRSGRVANKP